MSSVEPGTSETTGTEVESAPTPLDDPYQTVLEVLRTELGAGFVASETQRGELWARVARDSWKKAAEVLRFQLGYDYFSFLSAIDWMPHTWPNPKVVEGEADEEPEPEPEPAPVAGDGWQTGVTGGDTRFQLLARVYSTTRHNGVILKCDLDDEAPQAPTWHEVYPGADWHERETWEMFGIDFAGHPNLINLYLPSGFEGHPLRKDFPLLSREVKPWPGLVDVEGFPAGYGGDDAPEEGS
ncbi:MAG TPA: NADH-quinone oxidoreductase subunit C [Acidimicrobiales bacterium]|nr:NADH-quinone oxidoreductase subunit C [Acidimicrobiales bacterium]